jgi:hypothetical protein
MKETTSDTIASFARHDGQNTPKLFTMTAMTDNDLSIKSQDLSIKSDLKPTNLGELEACVKSFFEDYLNIRECSDAGRMWAPIAISCARAMKLEPLGILIERMRVLSGARKAHDE